MISALAVGAAAKVIHRVFAVKLISGTWYIPSTKVINWLALATLAVRSKLVIDPVPEKVLVNDSVALARLTPAGP
jgi:hypothetical protein